MKITTSLLLSLSILNMFCVLRAQCPTASNNVTINCGLNTLLNAGTPALNYAISASSGASLLTPASSTTITTLTDDSFAGGFNIGFPFTFYGNTYTQFYISSNGYISFGAGNNARASNTIPSGTAPNNMIAGALTDLNPTCAGTVVRYGVLGAAPNRRMVITFENIRRLGCGNPAITFQIIINEDQTFDIIYGSLAAGFGTATAGAENNNGSVGIGIAGMNNQAFPTITTPTAYSFTPVTPLFTGWTVNGQTVSNALNYTVSPSANTTYTANWDLGNGTTCQDPVTVTVNTGITGDPLVELCSGAQQPLVVTSSCYEINPGGSIAVGSTFNQGSTSTTSPTYRRPQGWLPCDINGNTNFYYHVYQFSVSTQGQYTFNNCSPNVDAHAALYQNTFDPNNVCGNSNFIVANDDGSTLNCGSDPQLTATLQPGVIYYIVTTTWSSGTVIPGFSWTYSAGPNGGLLLANVSSATPPNWYTSSTSSDPIYSGDSMNPFTTAGSGVTMNTVEGSFDYYVSCPSTPQCRYQVTLNIAPIHTVEDLTICAGETPVLTAQNSCGPTSTYIPTGTTFNSGSLNNTSPRWGRNSGGTNCNGTTTPSQYYSVFTFQVSVAGSYTFDMCTTVDAHASLYQNAFNPAIPCEIPSNFIVANDDGNGANCNLDPRLTANLVPGVTYFLVSTTLSNNVSTNYSWNYSTTAPGGQIMSQVGDPGDLQWYSDLRDGNLLATSDTYNPFANTTQPNVTSATTYTYYVSCSTNTTCRTPVQLTINPAPQAPTSITGGGAICHGTTTQLEVNGGALPAGAEWTWYEGACNSTPIGTGQSINVTPNTSTIYFVNIANSACGVANCISTEVSLPTPGNQLGNNTETATCVVNQNGYVHFYHESGRLIASINSFGQNLGNVSATVYTGNPVDMDACDNPTYMTTAMGRHWVVTPEFQPATPIDVVLPFYDNELNQLIPAANSNISAWDDVNTIGDLLLSKYSGPNNVDDLASNNCPDFGGNGGTTIHNQTANGLMNTIIPTITANSMYTRHNIPDFSELWLHGSTTLTPLGNSVLQFEASCDQPFPSLNWVSVIESSIDYFLLESSENGLNWSTITQVDALQSSEDVQRYQVTLNLTSEASYFRLTSVKNDGSRQIEGTIVKDCNKLSEQVNLFPNPTTGVFHLALPLTHTDEQATVIITDVKGRVIEHSNWNLVIGSNIKTFDSSTWSNGTYMIQIQTESNNYPLQRLIIQH